MGCEVHPPTHPQIGLLLVSSSRCAPQALSGPQGSSQDTSSRSESHCLQLLLSRGSERLRQYSISLHPVPAPLRGEREDGVQKYFFATQWGKTGPPNTHPGAGPAHGWSPGHLSSLGQLKAEGPGGGGGGVAGSQVPCVLLGTTHQNHEKHGRSQNWLSREVAKPQVTADNCLCATHADAS